MWRSVAIGVVLAGVVAGCSWGSDTATVSIGPGVPPNGIVAGRLVVLGGVQFPHHKKPLPATNTPFAFVAVSDSGRMLVRHLKTDVHGRFRLSIPPGGYRVGATFTESAPLAVSAKKGILVAPGRVTHLRLTEGVR